ncbi:MAG: PHP domain-containing protein [Clostridia bacterium]|nr:PHP domain-containing protein [Clostridia bacterium]
MEKSSKKYKTETHCHTLESSLKCGKLPAKEIVRRYVDAGYDTLVITDHYGGKHVSGDETRDLSTFFEGYNSAKTASQDINIILGVEVNLCESANDYLVYGITEEIIRENPLMYTLPIKEFVDFAHQYDLLVYQAHPFRNGLKIIPPDICDGIEVFNAHFKHDSRNNIALEWAKMYGKKMISGSDAHHPEAMAKSGILTDTKIKTTEDLMNVLRNDNFELITY